MVSLAALVFKPESPFPLALLAVPVYIRTLHPVRTGAHPLTPPPILSYQGQIFTLALAVLSKTA